MLSQNKRTRICHKYKTFIALDSLMCIKAFLSLHISLDLFLSDLSLNMIHDTCFRHNKGAHGLKNIYTSNLNYTSNIIFNSLNCVVKVVAGIIYSGLASTWLK